MVICAGAYKVAPWITRLLGGDAGSRFDGWLLTVSSQVCQFFMPLQTPTRAHCRLTEVWPNDRPQHMPERRA